MKIDVQTQTTSDGLITQEISTEFNNVREVLVRQVISTQDAQVREALIKLGWTPPGADAVDHIGWLKREAEGWKAHAESADRQLKEAREEVQRLNKELGLWELSKLGQELCPEDYSAAPQPPTANPEQESVWQPSTALQTEPVGKVTIGKMALGTVSDEGPLHFSVSLQDQFRLVESPSESSTRFFAGGEEKLRVARDGFYVRGVKLEISEQEARRVFDEFNAWMRSTTPQPSAVSAEPAYVIFDGPPSHDAPRFVEVEDAGGFSKGGFEWSLHRGTGYWKLGPFYPSPPSADAKDAALKLAKETLENLVGVDATERLMMKEAVAAINAAMQKGTEK